MRQGKAFNAINTKQLAYVSYRFEKLVNTNDGAKKIVEAFYKKAEEDGKPVNATKLEEALADYANAMQERIDSQGEDEGETIPSGETYGSDIDIGFDVSAYLDD